MDSARITQWMNLLVCALLLLKAEANFVPITRVEDAVSKGAVCLDGSPPAYHFDKGFGDGVNNWIVHIEGGGWCNDVNTCLSRKDTRLGSSNHMAEEFAFSGILSNEQQFNPDFYNWNRVRVRYCDGASFTGNVEDVDTATNLRFRGARIFLAVMEDLLAKGMKNAENAILSGCSAGGLTTILHCDRFKDLFPTKAKVKCVSDAGYFVNVMDISGAQHIAEFYNQVVATHGSGKNLPPSCTSRLSPGLCFFPQYTVSQISAPIFFVNAAYDSWQIKNILAPGQADPHGHWHSCKHDINKCSPEQLSIIQGFRMKFLRALNEVGNSSSNGMFIDSCYVHCQTETQETWFGSDSPFLGNKAFDAPWPIIQANAIYFCSSMLSLSDNQHILSVYHAQVFGMLVGKTSRSPDAVVRATCSAAVGLLLKSSNSCSWRAVHFDRLDSPLRNHDVESTNN